MISHKRQDIEKRFGTWILIADEFGTSSFMPMQFNADLSVIGVLRSGMTGLANTIVPNNIVHGWITELEKSQAK